MPWLVDMVKSRPTERGEVAYTGDELADALLVGWAEPNRHELALGFGGWAAKNSLPRERAIGIIEEVAAGAGDEEAQDRVTAVTTSFDRVKAGEDVAGYRTLETILPADALEVFQDFGPQRNNGGGSHMANGQPASNGELTAPVMELTDRGVLDRIKDEKLQPLSVVATPWPTWNRVCRGAGGGEGLAHGWHVLIGASSGAGKSLAAINLAAAAMRVGEHVCLISLEMSQQEVLTRLMSIYSGQEARKLEHGRQFSTEAWEAATEELQEARGSIRVNPDPISRLDQIAAVIERYHGEGCRTFIIDYLQLAWVRSAETMVHQITEVSHTIRGLAREHRLLSIGLSQINRQTSAGGELRKEGLLGGSSLENDADQVMLIGRQEQHGQGAYRAEVKLDKNRHGPPVSWAMILDTKTLRMRESMPDEEASWSVG